MGEIVSVGDKYLEEKLQLRKRIEVNGMLFFKVCQEESPLIGDNWVEVSEIRKVCYRQRPVILLQERPHNKSVFGVLGVVVIKEKEVGVEVQEIAKDQLILGLTGYSRGFVFCL